MAGHLLNGIELPRGMLWVDEFAWQAVAKTMERSITGKPIIDVAMKKAGRPITLEAAQDHGWMKRSTLLAVQALAEVAEGEYTLVLADGREFTVQFAEGERVVAHPLQRPELPSLEHPYIVTLRFITV